MSELPVDVAKNVERMKRSAYSQVSAMRRAWQARRGELASIWPDKFSDDYPQPIVANFIDQAARDIAANLSPLPSLACSAGQMRTDADRRRAETKNRIGANYWRHSRLQTRMKWGADQYVTYGFLPFLVEADYKNKLPLIQVVDPIGCYFDLNRWLETERFARCYREDLYKLAAKYPEKASQILRDNNGRDRDMRETEVVHYVDNRQVILYAADCDGLVLDQYEHGLDFCPVHIALRPGIDLTPRGMFDDVLWVQLAHAVMAALTLEAGHKAVQAPIAIPSDVNELPIGPDALIQSDNPEKIGRVGIEVPSATFALGQQLQDEMRQGVGYPETRLGIGPAGGSTGRGVTALEGNYDSQIKLGQDILGEGLRVATEMGFKMEATLWPNVSKTINGVLSGESFQVTYVPSRDLQDTNCEVTYGFASGLSPNAAIVTLLQLRGDSIIGRDTFRRNLPIDIDVDQQKRELIEQQLEDATMQGLAAALQASGQMMAQGQGAEAMQFYKAAVGIINGVRKGRDFVDLVQQTLIEPTETAQQEAAEAQQGQADGDESGAGGPGGGPGGGELDGVMPNGLPMGVAPGQAGMPPGGRPSVQDLVASFSANGKPNLGDTVRRRLATG